MIVPREGGLVRFYTQLKDVEREPESGDGGVPRAAARIDRSKITADLILGTARKIMQPYTLDVAEISWFTGYQIGQRIAPKFQKFERVFIAGTSSFPH
jgi:phenol 2-monooxygenase